MEKVLKIVRIITITLMVVLLSALAFLGAYAKRNNIWKQLIPEFNCGIELGKNRELRYALDTSEEEKNVYIDADGNILGEVKEDDSAIELQTEETTTEGDTEEVTEGETTENAEETTAKDEDKPNYATEVRTIKANEDNVKTIDNFQKAKSIIQKRLEDEDVYEYNIRLDTITGELILEIPNDDNVSIAHTAVTSIGNFEIIDDQTGIILIDNSDIKKAEAGMYQSETGYQVCLQIYFNKEGTEKLKNISNEYREVVNDAGETETTYVSAMLDGQAITTTYFGEELPNGLIQIPLGSASTDSATINQTLNDARRIAFMIDEEKLPIAYTLSADSLVESRITERDILIAFIVFAVAVLAISIVLIIKYKGKGAIASILGIGFIAILNLVVRYTGISVTINSTIAFIIMIILNYVFMKLFLLERKNNEILKEAFLKAMKKYYLTIIPICIIAVVFTFVSNIAISSIGMILFWGLLLQAIYNSITILGLALI